MPVLDGYELAKRIRDQEQDDAHVPIIALSASALQGEADRCAAVGMDAFLSKPARLKDLEAVLKKWIPKTPKAVTPDITHAALNAANDAPPVNLSILEDLVGAGTAMIPSLLQDYQDAVIEIRDELIKAWSAGKLDEVAALAHKLKSSSRTIGAVALGDICEKVEVAGLAYSAQKLGEFIPHLEAELLAVENFISSRTAPAA